MDTTPRGDRKAEKAARERDIFDRFARQIGLPVVPGSIASQEEPSPDIICDIQQSGSLAFEIFTMDSEFLLEDLAEHRRTEQLVGRYLPPGCPALRALEAKFGRVRLAVYFSPRSTLRQREAALPPLVAWLINHGRYNAHLGHYVSVLQALRPPVDRVIHYGSTQRFQLAVGQIVTSATSHAFANLKKKLTKKYLSRHPIELLAYTERQSWDLYERVKAQIEEVIVHGIGKSSFRRVWVADMNSQGGALKFVWPPLG